MRILSVHEYYRQPGGEDEVFEREQRLLRSAGHEVNTYVRENKEIDAYSLAKQLTLPLRTISAPDSSRNLRGVLRVLKPDVVHFHNTFPLISPGVYGVCQDANIPVVQSLHNPRLICPAATLYRDGRLCEECVEKTPPWPAVVHGCYHCSRFQTLVVATMITFHRLAGTWQKKVNAFVVFTKFFRQLMIRGGLPADKIAVKPHFVDPTPSSRTQPGEYALFMGRLSPEKGVPTLLAAWQHLEGISLKIRGDGPLAGEVSEFASRRVGLIGIVPRLPASEVPSLLQGARFLVWPSEGYYETFGLVAIEAFACGVPVIASGLGAPAEIVSNGRTGLHFRPGDAEDLAAKVEWAWTHPAEMETMGRAARAEYEAKYTPQRNYELLMGIYERVIGENKNGKSRDHSG